MRDCPQLVPLVDAVRANLGLKPREISADAVEWALIRPTHNITISPRRSGGAYLKSSRRPDAIWTGSECSDTAKRFTPEIVHAFCSAGTEAI